MGPTSISARANSAAMNSSRSSLSLGLSGSWLFRFLGRFLAVTKESSDAVNQSCSWARDAHTWLRSRGAPGGAGPPDAGRGFGYRSSRSLAVRFAAISCLIASNAFTATRRIAAQVTDQSTGG